ncbi:MAG: 1-phosphofructokinase [Lachnospiraceae bacterium]|nr:1-phosphofructokinase [Lachnospiraceae bacterium]
MITTVTLNPAIDKTCTTQSLLLGQVNRMQTIHNHAGGKGINVARILRQYDIGVSTLGFIGGYSGTFIENHLREIKAVTTFTKVNEETRVSTNIVAADGFITEILEPGPEITKMELEHFLADFKLSLKDSDLIVLSGSVPRGIASDIYAKLISIAKKQDRKVILDTSGDLLVEGVREKPYMIKPNLKELEYLVKHPVRGVEAVAETSRGLVQKGITHVLVSLGRKGIVYASSLENKVLYAKAPEIKVKNTIGCGDSVVASFCISQLSGQDMQETLRNAVAISAAAATLPGIAIIPPEKVKELYNEIIITGFDN